MQRVMATSRQDNRITSTGRGNPIDHEASSHHTKPVLKGHQGLGQQRVRETYAERHESMANYTNEEYLARIAGEIMFSDQYLDLLESTYSAEDTITEFETDPKGFLVSHGIHIPDAIEVIIHHRGAIARPARVDFHWDESAQIDRSDVFAARQTLRELARVAWDTLHSREMKQLRQALQASPAALREFASAPRAYAAAHQVTIPDEIELIVHLDDPDEPRIDAHFDIAANGNRPIIIPMGGCCYCQGGGCCYYARF